MTILTSNNKTISSTPAFEFDRDQTRNVDENMSPNTLLPLILGNLAISSASLLSQIVVILIAVGLEGDYSAKTLMWVQAVTEMLKRMSAMVFQTQQLGKKFFHF